MGAVGQLVTTGWQLIDARINVLEGAVAGKPLPSGALTPSQDAAGLAAANIWGTVFHDAHIFAGSNLFNAMQNLDGKRRDLSVAVNAAHRLPGHPAVVAALKDAKRKSDEMSEVAALNVLLNLQRERFLHDSNLCYLGHTVSIRRFAKFIDNGRRRELRTAEERIKELNGPTSA